MNDAVTGFIAPQSDPIEPEVFQARLIERITSALLREPPPPCLLRAPTGAGKTFIIAKVLEAVSEASNTLWFWFVPFVNLVQQTEDQIASHASGLVPVLLSRGRNQEPSSGLVLLSTAQGVARASARKSGYRNDADDDVRSLADLVDRGRGKGLTIGLVVDEAHIGLDSQTEFGQFARWLRPDRLIMASATPKDQRLTDFLGSAGFSAFESFAASRDEVVAARLNKKYIEAVVYNLRKSMQTVTDLQQTVLKQAWLRNQRIKRVLQANSIPVVPLLLVQVANGANSVEEAKQHLMRLCKVPPQAIGEHSADEPNPVLMAAIANDTTKEVLIFKQSAGTGFDAPRAFVLASTKPVNDSDFALQFIGRVMRVTQQVRRAFPRPIPIPADLDTAFIYLANAEAQQGFEQAVRATSQLKSQLEGQTERLVAQETKDGAVVYRNRESDQAPLLYTISLQEKPPIQPADDGSATPAKTDDGAATPGIVTGTGAGTGGATSVGAGLPDDLFGDDPDLDIVVPSKTPAQVTRKERPKTEAALFEYLGESGLRVLQRTERGAVAPKFLKRETKPELDDMSAISRAAATKLTIEPELERSSVQAALDLWREKEVHTELTTGKLKSEEDVAVVTDRVALAREALAHLRELPQIEDEDARIIISVLTSRLEPVVLSFLQDTGADAESEPAQVKKWARDAAYWVIRKESDKLGEILFEEIAAQAVTEDAASLPDFYVFPSSIGLEPSSRNIFGVLPPSAVDVEQVAQAITIDVRELVTRDLLLEVDGQHLLSGAYDGGSTLNNEERDFAKALDRADFVSWWHRNPDRKPYSVRIARGEHKNYFYPDFVVCVEHAPGDVPLVRLIETKENVKDAARKSKHTPDYYGQVIFLTKDQKRLRVVNKDGSLGDAIDIDDLSKLKNLLRETRPIHQP